jgi:hypothetical protein
LVWIGPGNARAGTSARLTLTGAGFSPDANVTVSGDGIKVATVTVDSETQLTATLIIAAGAKAGAREVTVAGPAGSSNSLFFRVTGPVPVPAAK